MSPPGPGTTDDARLNAVTVKQAAWIGAIVTLIATIISVSINVPLARWTAKKAAENAVEIVNLQTNQSIQEFLRGQRLELYSNVITADNVLKDIEDEQEYAVFLYARGRSGGPKPNRKKLEASYTKWHNYDASITIIASPGVKDIFRSQAALHERFQGSYDRAFYGARFLRDPKTPARHRKYYKRKIRLGLEKMPARRGELEVQRANFVRDACVDMGNRC
jgi:hypothetical protein